MREYTVAEIADLTGGKLIGPEDLKVSSVSIDTRASGPGDLFVAIKGEKVDAHDLVPEAFAKGAVAALVERDVDLGSLSQSRGIIRVASTIRALQELAKAYRDELDICVIGVTGSVGKTSTKDLVHGVISRRYRAYKNPGNLNSHIGMPLALLGIKPDCEVAVLEMAMRARGEIQELCRIARPQIGILTDISMSHVGVVGSIESIALAKSELLESLPGDGLALLCGDNNWVRKVSSKARCRKIFYGFDEGNDCRCTGVELNHDGTALFEGVFRERAFRMRLNIPGKHQVQNALAAVALGFELGATEEEIQEGLLNVTMSPMRLEVIQIGSSALINDAYNASPRSTKAALELLDKIARGRRRVAVLGDMLELGDFAPEAHQDVGTFARAKADCLVTVGELSRFTLDGWLSAGGTDDSSSASWFSDKEQACEYLRGFLREGDVVLVKASRAMGFETVAGAVRETLSGSRR